MTAATLDSCPAAASGWASACPARRSPRSWYGVRFDKPLSRTRQYVEIVRKAHGAASG